MGTYASKCGQWRAQVSEGGAVELGLTESERDGEGATGDGDGDGDGEVRTADWDTRQVISGVGGGGRRGERKHRGIVPPLLCSVAGMDSITMFDENFRIEISQR